MKHEILEEVWRARDKISAECGYDIKRLAARMRRLEGQYADRLVRLPIARRPKPQPASELREESPKYGSKSGRKPERGKS
jgi:hypothetical protein